MKKAASPFRFFTRLALTQIRSEKAHTAEELLGGLRTLPDGVIYFHTHRFLHEHQFLVPEPMNDFAYWAEKIAGEPALAKGLSGVNPLRHSTLAQVRSALVAVVDAHVRKNPGRAPLPAEKAFQFMSARRFSIPTPHTAANLEEMVEALGRVTHASLYLHLFEAKLRLPPGENDFSVWLSADWGDPSLAEKIRGLDLSLHTLEEIKNKMVAFLRSSESSHA